MRKLLFLALTLLTVMSATLPRPAEAACSWQCGECGAYCPCDRCFGPPPPCVCT